MKRQSNPDQVRAAGNKQHKAHAFLQEEMDDNEEFSLDEEPDFGNAEANYYASPELDYYEPYAFNQPKDPPEVFHVQDHGEYECRYCERHFPSNNKLHTHLRNSCQKSPNHSIVQEEDHETFTLGVVTDSVDITKNVEDSKKRLQSSPVVHIPIVASSVDPSKDIGTGYGFRGHHYLKGRWLYRYHRYQIQYVLTLVALLPYVIISFSRHRHLIHLFGRWPPYHSSGSRN